MSETLVRALFKSNKINWKTKSISLIPLGTELQGNKPSKKTKKNYLIPAETEFSIFINEDSSLNLDKIKEYMPQNPSYYNSTKGFLSEVLSPGPEAIILNYEELEQNIFKNLLKKDLSPSHIREEITSAINSMREVVKKEELPQGTEFIILGPLSFKQKEKLMALYSLPNLASQTDICFKKDGVWVEKSLKTSINGVKNFGLKNTSPVYIVSNIQKLCYDKSNVFLKTIGIEVSKTTTHRQIKEKIRNNKLEPRVNDFVSTHLFPYLISIIIKELNNLSDEELFTKLHSLINADGVNIIGSINLKKENYAYSINCHSILKNLFNNRDIKYEGGSTFYLGDILKLRIKFSNGNCCSPLKMQIDFK